MSGIPAWAVPGAKVVCISKDWLPDGPQDCNVTDPVKGEIYTISSVKWDGYVGLYLVGFPDAFYEISGFRPIATRSLEQDVAEFRKLLDHVPETVA